MTPFGFSGLLAGTSALGFGLFVLLKSPDRRIARIWFAFSLSVATWGFAVLGMDFAKTERAAWLAWNVGYTCGVIWIASLFYHFVSTFLELKNRTLIVVNYMVSAVFLALYPSRLFFTRLQLMWHSIYFARSGPIHYVFFVWWAGLVIYSHLLMIRAYPSVNPLKKKQIAYMFLATSIGYTGGSASFLNDFGFAPYPWGQFGVFMYPIIMSYAIVKHQLMDISVILRKTAVYSLVSAILIAVYVGIVTLLSRVFEGRYGSTSMVFSALTTIAIALMFNPLRMFTQRWIDRRFPRERFDSDLLQEAAGGFAHEMKRPLAKISLPAELALLDVKRVEEGEASFEETAPMLKERLQFIMRQSSDAGQMIEAIRAVFASQQAPQAEVHPRDVVNAALAVEREHLEKQNATVHISMSDRVPLAFWRAKQVEIVLVNLIKNAVESMESLPAGQPREIQLIVAAELSTIVMTVRDSGPGFRAADAKHLFQPAFTTKGPRGTGLGLYVSRQLIEAHGGTLQTAIPEGSGAAFIVRLPIKP